MQKPLDYKAGWVTWIRILHENILKILLQMDQRPSNMTNGYWRERNAHNFKDFYTGSEFMWFLRNRNTLAHVTKCKLGNSGNKCRFVPNPSSYGTSCNIHYQKLAKRNSMQLNFFTTVVTNKQYHPPQRTKVINTAIKDLQILILSNPPLIQYLS